MTNDELLKLAAKAYGIEVLHSPDGVLRNCTGLAPTSNIFAAKPWNPLDNNGEALKLAVKLNLDICGSMTLNKWRYVRYQDKTFSEISDDPCFAVRRAIVYAAAEIGKAMQ